MRYLDFKRQALTPQMRRALDGDSEGWDTVHLFVYGTLLSGLSNHWLLAGLMNDGHAKFLGKGFTPSIIVMSFGGLPAAYPVMARNTPRTMGEIYSCTTPAIKALDLFEGVGVFYNRDSVSLARTHSANGHELAASKQSVGYTYMGPSVQWHEGAIADVMCYADHSVSNYADNLLVNLRDGMGCVGISDILDNNMLCLTYED